MPPGLSTAVCFGEAKWKGFLPSVFLLSNSAYGWQICNTLGQLAAIGASEGQLVNKSPGYMSFSLEFGPKSGNPGFKLKNSTKVWRNCGPELPKELLSEYSER